MTAQRQYTAQMVESSNKSEVSAPLGDERLHYWLALEMSRTMGLNLQEEIDSGRMSQGDWAGMVTRCRGCDWAGGCPAWMAQARAPEADPVGRTPTRCANSEHFDALLNLADLAEQNGDALVDEGTSR